MGRLEKPSSHQLFSEDCLRLSQQDSRFKLIRRSEGPFLRGVIKILDQERCLEQFEVEIHFKEGYPFVFPKLFEISGKIPRLIDWHIFANQDNSCCLTVPIQERIYCADGMPLETFIRTHATYYLYNQTHRMLFGFYADKEYSHAIDGPWEFYYEFFGTQDKTVILECMRRLAGHQLGKSSLCYCGRKARMRRCHPDVYRLFKKLDPTFLRNQLKMLVATQNQEKMS